MKRLLVLGLTLGVLAVGSSAYTPKAERGLEVKEEAKLQLHYFLWTGDEWMEVTPENFPTCEEGGDDCGAISDQILDGQPAGDISYFGQP